MLVELLKEENSDNMEVPIANSKDAIEEGTLALEDTAKKLQLIDMDLNFREEIKKIIREKGGDENNEIEAMKTKLDILNTKKPERLYEDYENIKKMEDGENFNVTDDIIKLNEEIEHLKKEKEIEEESRRKEEESIKIQQELKKEIEEIQEEQDEIDEQLNLLNSPELRKAVAESMANVIA